MPLPYYITRCTECGEKTTKKYAENHRGYCKSCVDGKPKKKDVEEKEIVLQTEIRRNFKRPGIHWIAKIFKFGLGWAADVTCVQSKVYPPGFKTTFYEVSTIDELCKQIAAELAERENPNGIYNTKTV